MKIKHILKTSGLISALSFSSLFLVSCDDDDNNTTSTSGGSNNGGSSENSGSTEIPEASSNLTVGGVFLADVGDGVYRFTLTSVEGDSGTGTLEVPFFNNHSVPNLAYSYDGTTLTITDNRFSDEEVNTSIRQLAGTGGAAEAAFNAVLQNDSDANIDSFIEAVANATTDYLLDYNNGADEIFVTRSLVINSRATVSGSRVDGETASALTVNPGSVISYDDPVTFTYQAPQ